MIVLIAARDMANAIGRGGKMPWHLPRDLARFRQVTIGRTVVMGHKTWDSLPVKPLPDRRNIVVSRDPDLLLDGAEVMSLEDAAKADDDIFVIGGQEIYEQFIGRADRIYITEVAVYTSDADAFFPQIGPEWVDHGYFDHDLQDGIYFQFKTFERARS